MGLRSGLKRGANVAFVGSLNAITGIQRRGVIRPQSGGVDCLQGRGLPQHLDLSRGLLGLPERLGHHRHSGAHFENMDNARHRFCASGIHGLRFGSGHGCTHHYGIVHIRNIHVDPELRCARRLGDRIDPLALLTDVLKLGGWF